MGKFYFGLYEALSLYVRHVAWLNAVPEKKGKLSGKDERHSRLQQMRIDRKDEDYEPELPPIDAPYLIGYLWDVGPVLSGGMGPAAVSFSELQAWERATGIDLQPWESRILRRLSMDYIAESHKAEKADCPAPWTPEAPDREVISRKVQSVMRSFMRAR